MERNVIFQLFSSFTGTHPLTFQTQDYSYLVNLAIGVAVGQQEIISQSYCPQQCSFKDFKMGLLLLVVVSSQIATLIRNWKKSSSVFNQESCLINCVIKCFK